MFVSDRDSADGSWSSADRLLADAARAAAGASARLKTARIDLFVVADSRLSDQQRIAMARILSGLVTAVEDEFRRRLVELLDEAVTPELVAALGTARVEIAVPILDRARLLHNDELVAILLRRADEHRLASALRGVDEAAGGERAGLIDRLLGHPGEGVAAAAMALLIAESRRFDRFGDPILARTDLPAEMQHRLVWWVAAALRDYMVDRHAIAPAAADRPIVAAAMAILAGYDEGETLEGRAFALANRLQPGDALDDRLLADAVAEGRLALFAAALSLRAGVEGTAAWDSIADQSGSRLAVLLRAIECQRDIAAGIMFRLADAHCRPDDEIAAHIDAFEQLDRDRAREALRPWRLDSDYRRAIAALATPGDGR